MKELNSVGQAGQFKVRLLDSEGKVKSDWETFANTGVDQGLTYMQSTAFQRGPVLVSPIASWFIGIYSGSVDTETLKGTTAATVAADTTEITDTNYNETGRIAWAINDIVGNNDTDRTITNSTVPAVFTFITSATIEGAFIVSEQTSGGVSAAATLFAISNFTSARAAQAGDVLQIVYDTTLSSAAP